MRVLRFLKAAPVLRVEDTEGEPLPYEHRKVPSLPLIERAVACGINVKAVPGNFRYYGSYSMQRKEIVLATAEECVFFHEVGHVAHEKVIGELKGGQVPYQAIVAELSPAALCKMVGRTANETLGNSFRYIESYAKELNQSPYSACMKILSQTEKVLNLILK